jgi:MFS family permease
MTRISWLKAEGSTQFSNQMGGSYGYIVAFSAAMGGLLFGYEIGVVGGVLDMDAFGLFVGKIQAGKVADPDNVGSQIDGYVSTDQGAFVEGMVTFMFLLGCSLGAIIVSMLADAWGRKKTIMLAGTIFVIGGACQSFAPGGGVFFTGRFVSGLAIGVLSMCAPLYISECLQILAKLRSAAITDESVKAEYNEIIDSVSFEKSIGDGSWGEVFAPGVLNRTVRAAALQFWQQWTGINVILYYQNTLLKGMNIQTESGRNIFAVINNLVNCLATFPGMYLIERLGRRTLLIAGGLGMGTAHYLVCIFVTVGDNGNGSANWAYWCAIFSVYIFIFNFASTWGPIGK